jgi:hypothetical protein
LVVVPIALVLLAIVVQHDALALTVVVNVLAVVDGLLVFFEFEVRGCVESGEVDFVGAHVFEVLEELLVRFYVAVYGADHREVD